MNSKYFWILIVFLLPGILAFAETPCAGSLWKAKYAGVPLYDRPSRDGAVLRRLELGEKICVVGEKDAFAIVSAEEIQKGPREVAPQDPSKFLVVYAKTTDIREVEERQSQDFLEWIQGMYEYIRSGGVFEKGILP